MLGASLLSAAASLPLHLLPLLVVAVTSQGMNLAQAGWIGSAYMIGQLAGTIALPLLKMTRLTPAQAGLASALILGGLFGSAAVAGPVLVLPWLVIGLACGALQFLAATTAAAAGDRGRAFSMRLGVTLLIGGFAIAVLRLMDGLATYQALTLILGSFACVLLAVGLAFYRAPADALSEQSAGPVVKGHVSWGLVLMFLVFLGQTGFWAYAIQHATERGVRPQDSAYAIAFCKAAAGCYLLSQLNRKNTDAQEGVLLPGLVVMAAVGAMSFAQDFTGFLLGMLAWELGLNILSARLQSLVTHDNPTIAGRWLAGAVFLGAASGPALHGAALAVGAGALFMMFSALSSILPWCWISLRRRRSRGNEQAVPAKGGPA